MLTLAGLNSTYCAYLSLVSLISPLVVVVLGVFGQCSFWGFWSMFFSFGCFWAMFFLGFLVNFPFNSFLTFLTLDRRRYAEASFSIASDDTISTSGGANVYVRNYNICRTLCSLH